jgi:hypothetical protein
MVYFGLIQFRYIAKFGKIENFVSNINLNNQKKIRV